MIKFHKIKAFTLTEMMVVLVISAIVTGLAFSILSLVQKNMKGLEGNLDYRSQLKAFEVAITSDFNKFPEVFWLEEENTLSFRSPLTEKKYQFYKDSIVTDINSFQLVQKNKEFFLEGISVNQGRIDAAKIFFENTLEPYFIFVYKENDLSLEEE